MPAWYQMRSPLATKPTDSARAVLVVWTERSEDLVRIISAWWATKTEEELYAEYLEIVR